MTGLNIFTVTVTCLIYNRASAFPILFSFLYLLAVPAFTVYILLDIPIELSFTQIIQIMSIYMFLPLPLQL